MNVFFKLPFLLGTDPNMSNLLCDISASINWINIMPVKGDFILILVKSHSWFVHILNTDVLIEPLLVISISYIVFELLPSRRCDFLICVSVRGVKTEPFQPHLGIKKQTGAFPDRLLYAQKSRWGQSDVTLGPSLYSSRNKTAKCCFYWSAALAVGTRQ